MKILVVGSGGREHALCWAFSRSGKVEKIFCANGNAGIGQIAECVNIKPDEIGKLADFAENNKIDITFVGGETSLALGIADEFHARNLQIVGVSKKAATLEASKAFAKNFMQRHDIPTAAYKIVYSTEQAKQLIDTGFFGDEDSPVVIKADGLAAGKGVIVARNREEAFSGLNSLKDVAGTIAAEKIILEEFLYGKEVSLLLFSDGKDFAIMPPARDHKRIGENDTGANTGGMGVITDDDLLSALQLNEIKEKIIKPTLNGVREDGFEFRGILFLGLMLTEDGVKVLEYNVRFGDPETQAILVRLETDLTDICEAIINQSLEQINVSWKPGNSACVVMASEGYPKKARSGDVIHGLDQAEKTENVLVFHAGTAKDEGEEFITAGGRVLGVTAAAEDLASAIERAYAAVNEITWHGVQFRRDIGK